LVSALLLLCPILNNSFGWTIFLFLNSSNTIVSFFFRSSLGWTIPIL
jgi:hypothetical protein